MVAYEEKTKLTFFIPDSFNTMAEAYIDFHLGDIEDLETLELREAICEKRLPEGWYLYSFLELKQRYHILGLSEPFNLVLKIMFSRSSETKDR